MINYTFRSMKNYFLKNRRIKNPVLKKLLQIATNIGAEEDEPKLIIQL
jgi:hypothetical protein